jgi:hypothetical protein
MSDGIHTYACLNPTILEFSQAVVNISSRVSHISGETESELIISGRQSIQSTASGSTLAPVDTGHHPSNSRAVYPDRFYLVQYR